MMAVKHTMSMELAGAVLNMRSQVVSNQRFH
jgi:hypothetical protein